MRLASFVAGFFRNHAAESSTRLVGIMGFIVGYALSAVLIVRSCTGSNVTERDITPTDLVVIVIVLSYAAIALKLRSPFPPEALAKLAGVELPKVETKVETSTETKVTT